ncbi:hypothetical protein [Alteribacter natronophilus]|uniref:hypothetical protein n=1 Tax=Alteribacter natronophilus TaxID=2583810 RepID=UPI00110D95DF|nr:hypothetical protein [Alteribacter natronophilus]TMW71721.1 hypothetical protein FGB90_11885 [Alteribacter natronophilus]
MPKKTKMSAGLYDNEGEAATHNQILDSYYQHSRDHETFNEEVAEELVQEEGKTTKKKKKKRNK